MPPSWEGWYLWLLLAGRGAGKSDACSAYFDNWMRTEKNQRGAIIAPTLGDAVESCVTGPSGLQAHNPLIRFVTRTGGSYVTWPNGNEARLFGCHTPDDVERLRAGGNRSAIWCEEIGAWRHLKEAWEHMEFGLRVGRWPHIIGSTTPKTKPKLKELIDMARASGTLSTATTFDNPHLPVAQRERLRQKYEGTRIGRQELMGEYLEDVEGALWSYEMLEGARWLGGDLPTFARVVVGVDPSGGDAEGNDEQGIVVAAIEQVAGGGLPRFFVLADYSCKLSPQGWGKRAAKAYDDHKADVVVAEKNFGGDMVKSTVEIAGQSLGLDVNIQLRNAARGKVARAEPIAALYEQHRVFHVGAFEELEEQLRTWTPDSGWSPDRLDAVTWTLSELALGRQQGTMRTFNPSASGVRLPTPLDRFDPV